jgi:hypothetical protein
MRKIIALLIVLLVGIGCTNLGADTPTIIKLSPEEKKSAQSIAEARQQLQYERQEATNAYQSQMNRFAERESVLNLQSSKLCFQLNKAHGLDRGKQYQLDEWKGELRR